MLEQALLREQFQDLLVKERQAWQSYSELASQAETDRIRDQLRQLCRDKQRHIELAERLLEILE